jgi:hypothetical protein
LLNQHAFKMKKIILFLSVFLGAYLGYAQERTPAPLKPTRIAVFKNNTYFSTEEGNVTSKDRTFYVAPPARALNGTFWYALKEAKVQTINVKEYTTRVTKKATSISDYLQSNINNEVTLNLIVGQGAVTPVKGTILAYYNDPEGRTVLLKMGDGSSRLIPIGHIADISLPQGTGNTFKEDSTMRLAKIMLDKEVSGAKFTTMSMQTGITWVPSYMLKLNDAKKASLDIKATIDNNAGDINGVPVSLVIGNPQMYYGMQLDLITGSRSYYKQGAVGAHQNTSYYAYDNEAREATDDGDGAAGGEKSNDLYYYNLGSLTLEKDALVVVKLGSSELEYKDLYELNIEDKVNYWQTRVASIDPATVYETLHVLKIDNKTQVPFSNGPVFVMDETGKPLAQDELKYTPVGASVKIKLSKAIDIQTCDDEEVVEHSATKTKINKREYELVKIKGKIKVINYQGKEVNISVSKTMNGKVTSNGGGTTTVLPNRSSNYMNVNDINVIRWEKNINPNETLVLDYEYEVLVFTN